MTPAHPATEETHTAHAGPASAAYDKTAPSWVELWAALEMWCLRWLVTWSARPEHRLMDVRDGASDGALVLPEHPLLAYRAAAPYLSLRERRLFAHRCCLRVAWMRGACGRFDVHLGRTHGGPKVIFAKWRRLFRVFVDYARSVRGDGVLPVARLGRALVRAKGSVDPPGCWVRPRAAPGQARGQGIY